MSFREDGQAALDWAARYLDRVGELPVLAQVSPGELSARLPAAPPERAEPFTDVLRDLDELILPALTNWQHPRFFAYFAVTASARIRSSSSTGALRSSMPSIRAALSTEECACSEQTTTFRPVASRAAISAASVDVEAVSSM